MTVLSGDTLFFPRGLYDDMISHCAAAAPLEAGGLLGGRAAGGADVGGGEARERAGGWVVTRLFPISNVEESETRFLLDPEGLYRAFLALEEAGEQLVGVFHSHPKSEALPSARDLDMAHYPDACYAIVSLIGEPVVRAFRLSPEKRLAAEVPICIKSAAGAVNAAHDANAAGDAV